MADVNDERDRDISRPSLADAIDLLDLVRTSEETARISTPSLAPNEPPAAAPVAVRASEVIDIGDDAEDAPPSLPPFQARPRSIPPPSSRSRRPTALERSEIAMPPAVAIVLMLGLAIGTLYAVLALPGAYPESRSEASDLQLEGSPK